MYQFEQQNHFCSVTSPQCIPLNTAILGEKLLLCGTQSLGVILCLPLCHRVNLSLVLQVSSLDYQCLARVTDFGADHFSFEY